MLNYELSRFKKGILLCYFDSLDIVQHMFWRYIDPEHPLYDRHASAERKEMIYTWYRRMDDVLGSVIKELNNNDTIIILSDHGFGTFRRAAHLNSWLRANGYLQLKNPQADSGAELLNDIDWSKTKAYAIGFGAIYINKIRFGNTKLSRLDYNATQLKEEISKKLEDWIDEKYNQRVVSKVYKNEEIFNGEYAKEAPDLYIGFNMGYRASWQTALGSVPKELLEDNLKKWSGDHLFDPGIIPGVILSNKKIIKDNPSIYDMAPTILKFIGYTDKQLKECDFDGNALF